MTLSGRYLVEHDSESDGLQKPNVVATPAGVDYEPSDISLPADSCSDMGAAQYSRAVNCSAVDVVIAANDLSPDTSETLQNLTLTNPAPVDCRAPQQMEVMVVRRPLIQSFLPSELLCVSESDQVCVRGGTPWQHALTAARTRM